MDNTLKDIPEFYEQDMGECVTSRTLSLSTCRELGPPDLCHVIKSNAKPNVKEMGCYHFVLGLDASSSATMAAYLNSLTYLMEVPQGWFSKTPLWRVRSGIYCCYNAFSRVDIRVEVKIPGGVEAYAVNSKAEKLPIAEDYWSETFVSAALRSMLYSDDLTYRIDGLRYFNIIPDLDSEMKFFEAVEKLFWKGHLLGGDNDLQFPSNVNNYLTDGIMKYLINTDRYHTGINIFAKLAEVDPEINSLLAKCYIDTNQEILAVQALYNGLKQKPTSFSLLLTQAEFMIKKDRLDIAMILMRRAVNVAPSEFRSWIKLAELYVQLKEYKIALLTLNSCPMFSVIEKELPKMPPPAHTHLPQKPEAILAYGLEEEYEVEQEQATALYKLPANALRGTFAKAYKLLTLIASKIGWDELLVYRASSFIMEEEYRSSKKDKKKSKSDKHNKTSIDQDNEQEKSTSDQVVKEGNKDSFNQDIKEKSKSPIENDLKNVIVSPVDQEAKDVVSPVSDKIDNISPNESVNHVEIENNSKQADQEESKQVNSDASDKEQDKQNEEENKVESNESKDNKVESNESKDNKVESNESKDNKVESNESKDNKVESKENEEDKDCDQRVDKLDSNENEEINIEDKQDAINEMNSPQIKVDLVKENSDDGFNDVILSPDPNDDINQLENKVELVNLGDINAEQEANTSLKQDSEEHLLNIKSIDRDNLKSPDSQISEASNHLIHKRLCERWLDNLFMVLYEDLRAFTSWRAEMNNTRSQRLTYRYSGYEWEALGDLCLRLHRNDEAQDAYTNCVHQIFSPRSWKFLLNQHTIDNELQLTMGALIRLAMYYEKIFNNCQIPNPVMLSFKSMIGLHGLPKIQNLLLSLDLAPEVIKVIQQYIDMTKIFHIKGADEV